MINAIRYRIVLSLGGRNEIGRCTPVHKNSFHGYSYAGYGNMAVHIILHTFLYVGTITNESGHDTTVETRYQKSKFHKCGI